MVPVLLPRPGSRLYPSLWCRQGQGLSPSLREPLTARRARDMSSRKRSRQETQARTVNYLDVNQLRMGSLLHFQPSILYQTAKQLILYVGHLLWVETSTFRPRQIPKYCSYIYILSLYLHSLTCLGESNISDYFFHQQSSRCSIILQLQIIALYSTCILAAGINIINNCFSLRRPRHKAREAEGPRLEA